VGLSSAGPICWGNTHVAQSLPSIIVNVNGRKRGKYGDRYGKDIITFAYKCEELSFFYMVTADSWEYVLNPTLKFKMEEEFAECKLIATSFASL
jgi:hypothetical protein